MGTIEKVPRHACFSNLVFGGLVAGLQQAHELEPELRDALEPDPSLESRFAGRLLLRCPCPSSERFGQELGRALVRTLAPLEVPSLLCAFESACPWLYQSNDYPAARDALDQVTRWLDGDRNFDGGLRADLAALPELVTVAFWLGRCCASLPHAYFVPPREPFVITICKYGDVHVEHYDSIFRERFERAADEAGLIAIERCRNQFDDQAPLSGRKLHA